MIEADKMFEENNEPGYNGWIIFMLVLMILFSEDWLLLGCILLAVIYAGWIEYLRMRYRISIKEIILKS